MDFEPKLANLLQKYFRGKQRELLAVSDLAVAEHSGLKGSHREQVIRSYLSQILPKRFEIGRGMIYGMVGQSHECDIVLWDAINYPSLKISDHNLFFAESVRAVLEIKSLYSDAEFKDIKTKADSIRRIYFPREFSGLVERISNLELELLTLKSDSPHDGTIIAYPSIAVCSLLFRGGTSLWKEQISANELEYVDNYWPDLILLLEAGFVIHKAYSGGPISGGEGVLEYINAGEDALLIFTAILTSILTERSAQTEDPLYLERYISPILEEKSIVQHSFPLKKPPRGRQILWQQS